jgi:GT2 family glycosyltransferase
MSQHPSQPTHELTLSVILATFNNLALTKACLASFEKFPPEVPFEVLLIDDCSTDGTVEFLKQLKPPFFGFPAASKGSFARSNNRGAAKARGHVLLLLNNDTELRPGWFKPMWQALHSGAKVACVSNAQWSPRTGRFDHLGVVFGPSCRPVHFGQYFSFRWGRGVRSWPAVTAACMMIRRDLFLEVGGFDESFKNGCEDVDLCLRFLQKGYRHLVARESVIWHQVSVAPGRHDNNHKNEQLLSNRWSDYIKSDIVPGQARLWGVNYLLGPVWTPGGFNFWRTVWAVRFLIFGGRGFL